MRREPNAIMFEFVRTLDDDEWDQISRAVAEIRTAIEGLDYLWKIALTDLTSTMDSIAGDLLDDFSLLGESEWWSPRLAFRLIAFSTSLRLFEEHTLALAKRRAGDQQSLVAQVRNEFSRTYDGSASYRLIYELRNVLVHGSTRSVGLGAKLSLESDDQRSVTLSAVLLRDVFLEQLHKSKPVLRQELLRLDEDPDLLTIVELAARELWLLNVRLKPLMFPTLAGALKRLSELAEEVRAVDPEARPQFMSSTAGVDFRISFSEDEHLGRLAVSRAVWGEVDRYSST
jgi:hypothetical protein